MILISPGRHFYVSVFVLYGGPQGPEERGKKWFMRSEVVAPDDYLSLRKKILTFSLHKKKEIFIFIFIYRYSFICLCAPFLTLRAKVYVKREFTLTILCWRAYINWNDGTKTDEKREESWWINPDKEGICNYELWTRTTFRFKKKGQCTMQWIPTYKNCQPFYW